MMKKYQQVSLLVFALISICGLLLYRKQYVELRTTFENFNIFGIQGSFKNCVVLNESLNIKNVQLSYPLSGWINLEDSFYVYSAHWQDNGISKAIGIGLKGKVPIFDCHIWHENRDLLVSNVGVFNFNEIQIRNSYYNVFVFNCDISLLKHEGNPHMFVFVSEKLKRFVPISKTVRNKYKDGSTLCVYPDYSGIAQSSIIEFVAYHQIIGFTDFIIYDELHYRILFKLEDIITRLGLVKSFTLLPWRVPINPNDLSLKAALELDCLQRTSNKAPLLAILNYEDYIIPKLQENIKYLINNNNSAKFILKQQTCCIGLKSDRLSKNWWPQILKKTLCISNSQNKELIINPKENMHKTGTLNALAAINSYKSCTQVEKSNAIYDKNARRFLNQLLKNEIILLWNSGGFFNNK